MVYTDAQLARLLAAARLEARKAKPEAAASVASGEFDEQVSCDVAEEEQREADRVARQQEADRQRQAARQAEAAARQAEAERQAEATRQAQAERQAAEAAYQAALERAKIEV